MSQSVKDRCRLVLVTPDGVDTKTLASRVREALDGGDVASIIVPQYQMDEDSYQALLAEITSIGQAAGSAVVAAGDSRIAGRCNVDGIHIIGGFTEVRTALREFGHKWIIGSGSAETRDAALGLGEEGPDYVFFGRFGQDTHAEPHKRNLELASWWSQVVEVPCIVMGGNELSSLQVAAGTGAEFVALSGAVFNDGVDSRDACHQANAALEQFVLEEASE